VCRHHASCPSEAALCLPGGGADARAYAARARYESVIATLCECLDTLDEPEARAAMVWVIGEYAERIDNADELLEGFLEARARRPGSRSRAFRLGFD